MHKTRNLFRAKTAQKGFRVSVFALFLCASCYRIFILQQPLCIEIQYSQMFPGYPDAVSLQQAAEMLGLNRHTVGELIRSRRLFALKIGRTYRIPKLSVIEFLLTGQSTFPAGNPPLDVVCCGCSNGQHAC